MNNQNEKSLGFNLFVDEDMSDLFTLFSNLYLDFEKSGADIKENPILATKSKVSFGVFLKKVTGPVHELGWCKDPNCKHKSGSDPHIIGL